MVTPPWAPPLTTCAPVTPVEQIQAGPSASVAALPPPCMLSCPGVQAGSMQLGQLLPLMLLLCIAQLEHCKQLSYSMWEQLMPIDTSVAAAQ